MRRKRCGGMMGIIFFTLVVLLAAQPVLRAQTSPHRPSVASRVILAVMDAQVAAWNRGDVVGFMQGYKDSPDTTFISDHVAKGYQAILTRYRKKYASQAQMGTLAFTDLEVRPLCAQYATVTGRFHLTRTADAGGDASGVFSLVFENTLAGWRIILDHTS